MERIVAIVEGHLEYHFMTQSYPRVLVQRCLPNGDDVKLDLIFNAIVDQLEVIDAEIKKVIILFDREGRSDDCTLIISNLKRDLAAAMPFRTFYVGVADREAENWILADEELISNRFHVEDYHYCGDGVAGKGRLKEIAGADLGPRDKAKLLKAISTAKASSKSPSLGEFSAQIDFPWQWASS